MLTKQYLEEFRDQYQKNCYALNEWGDRLFEKVDREAWIALLRQRSKEIRRLFREDEELLKELKERIPADFSVEEADALFDMTMELYLGGLDDIELIIRLCKALLPFYEKKSDAKHLLMLYKTLGDQYAIFYRLIKEEQRVDQVFFYYRKCVALRDRYSEIDEPRIRLMLFYAYYNLIMFLGHFEKASFSENYALICEMKGFAESEEVQRLDGQDEEFRGNLAETFGETYMELLFLAKRAWPFDAETKADYEAFRDRFLLPMQEEGRLDTRSSFVIRLLNGEAEEKVWLEEYYTYLLTTIPKIDFQDSDARREKLPELLNCFISSEFYLDCLKNSQLSDEEKFQKGRPVVRKGNEIAGQIPYLFQTQMANSFLAEWFTAIEPFLESGEERIGMLCNFLLRRQPVTYIHSLMVSDIARRIAETLIAKEPDKLIGILDCMDKEAVMARREELLQYVMNCGLLHDIGKCFITDVINRQSRALSDEEFQLIKWHPLLGRKVVNDTQSFDIYYDVILGHHKSYDGKFGYPASFDNVNAKHRIMIDLISIADSIDAATDILGRNYSEGKDFVKVLGELKEGAGSRYNPVLVRLIGEDEELIRELGSMTSDGRFEVYRRVYEEINLA